MRSLPVPLQDVIRQQCVESVLSGKNQSEAAREFGVSRQSVNAWMQLYNKSTSLKALKSKSRGRPKGIILLPWQIAQTVKAICHYCPDHYELPFRLWSRQAVLEFIKLKFNITLSKWTVGRYLKKWGFTSQKPAKRAYEQNKNEVDKWLQKVYPKIKQKAKRESGIIFWGDEMGLRSDDTRGRTYGRKGETPIVPTTGKRFSCNMISSITNQGKLYFMIFKKRFNSKVCIDFLDRFIRSNTQKAFLILDNHPVHHSKMIQSWIRKHKGKIEIFFLPSYCPELNPDELLNQDIKANAFMAKRPNTQEEMVKLLKSHLYRRQKQPNIIKGFFHGKRVNAFS